jgi:hypothetical protein
VIGVDVLDVPGAANALTAQDVHRLVFELQFPGHRGQRVAAVGTQHRVVGHRDLQRLAELCLGGRLQNEVAGLAGAV